MATKAELDFVVRECVQLTPSYSLLTLAYNPHGGLQGDVGFDFSIIRPGQFVQVRIDGCSNTFLRRPISISFVDVAAKEIQLLVRRAGEGTDWLCSRNKGDFVNVILPLGNGFFLEQAGRKPLLVGGGVGVAPLLYLGKVLNDAGITPTFLLAAKTAEDLLLTERFRQYGEVIISTDDGTAGAPGLVTSNPALERSWSHMYVCGPKPMMVALARLAGEKGVECEVSLENTMACGLGACLCCVEDTKEHGNVCVCTDGPVFNARDLKWI